MTATTAITPVELVAKIFVDMGRGPTEAKAMAGEFTTRAADDGLTLGNAAAIPPSGWSDGWPVWERSTASGEETPTVSIADNGRVIVMPYSHTGALSPEAVELYARHLLAAATKGRAQRAASTTTTTGEEQ